MSLSIHDLVADGKFFKLREVIKSGADLNQKLHRPGHKYHGFCPLAIAIRAFCTQGWKEEKTKSTWGCRLGVIEDLVSAGVVDYTAGGFLTPEGVSVTPLHLLAWGNFKSANARNPTSTKVRGERDCLTSLVRAALAAGVDIDAPVNVLSMRAATPLALASREGHVVLAQVLLECGAQPSAVSYGLRNGDTRFVERVLQHDTVPPKVVLQCLHMAGSKEVWQGGFGWTREAVIGSLLGVLQQRGIDINTPNAAGDSILHLLADTIMHMSTTFSNEWSRCIESARKVLEAGGSKLVTDSGGRQPWQRLELTLCRKRLDIRRMAFLLCPDLALLEPALGLPLGGLSRAPPPERTRPAASPSMLTWDTARAEQLRAAGFDPAERLHWVGRVEGGDPGSRSEQQPGAAGEEQGGEGNLQEQQPQQQPGAAGEQQGGQEQQQEQSEAAGEGTTREQPEGEQPPPKRLCTGGTVGQPTETAAAGSSCRQQLAAAGAASRRQHSS